MSKLNINPTVIFAPFESAIGEDLFPKVVNDCKSFLGRIEKDIKTTGGEWKCSAKGVLSSKDGNKVQMPLNNPMSVLIRFGMQLTEIASNGNFDGQYKLNQDGTEVEHIGLQAGIPKECQAWMDNMRKELKASQPGEATALANQQPAQPA